MTQASVESDHQLFSITYIDLRCEFGPDGGEVLGVPNGGEGARRAVLRRAEDELGPAEVVVNVVGQGHLRVRERVEHLLVLCIHHSFIWGNLETLAHGIHQIARWSVQLY